MITQLILSRRDRWHNAGKWQEPSPRDCALFLISECAELVKEISETLIERDGYTRNNPGTRHSIDKILEEISGIALMSVIFCEQQGTTFEQAIEDYLAEMDHKRGLKS